MPKVVRSFRTKADALGWVDEMKRRYKGRVIGGSTYSTDGRRMRAYVYGDIDEELAAEMRPGNIRNGYFEYKK